MAENFVLGQLVGFWGSPEITVGAVPLITVVGNVELYPFQATGRFDQFALVGRTELYPFETSALIFRTEMFDTIVNLPVFETAGVLTVAVPVSVEFRPATVRTMRPMVPTKIAQTPTSALTGVATLYTFESDALLTMPLGSAFRPVMAMFETSSAVEVETGIRVRAEMYAFETKSIVLVPPIVSRFTPELHPFQTSSLVTIPYRLAISNSLYAFETDTFVNLSNLFNGSGDLSEFESVLRVSPPVNINANTQLGEFVTKVMMRNDASSFISADQILPDFEVDVDARQTLYLNGSWIVPMPTINGEMDQGALRIEGIMTSPMPTLYGLLFADKNAFEIDGLLVAPLPTLAGAVSLTYSVSSLLVAPSPFIRGRLKKAAEPVTLGGRGSRPFIGISLNR